MKYDHSFHSGGGNGNAGGNDPYESRHNDVRSPSMHHHHHGGLVSGNGNGLGSNNGIGMNGNHQSHEQMNAMMSMFNPMMAAFIQQLTSGIQPNGGSQSIGLDPNGHVNGAGPALGHHHVQPPWNSNVNEYSRTNGSTGLASGMPPGNISGYNSSNYNGNSGSGGSGSRFKKDNF